MNERENDGNRTPGHAAGPHPEQAATPLIPSDTPDAMPQADNLADVLLEEATFETGNIGNGADLRNESDLESNAGHTDATTADGPPEAASETDTKDAEAPPSASPAGQHSRPPRSAMPALLLGLLALAVSGASLWMNMQASDRLERLEHRLVAMERRIAQPAAQPMQARLEALTDQVRLLEARLEKHLQTVARAMPPEPAQPGQTTTTPPQTEPAQTEPANIEPVQAMPTSHQADQPSTKAKHQAAIRHNPVITPATPRSGTMTGGWVVNLASMTDRRAAKAEVARLNRMGIAAERIEIKAGGHTWQRIRVTGFESRAAADEARKSLEQQLHIHDAWVSRR